MYVVVNFDEHGRPSGCNGTIFYTREEAFDMADLLASYLERHFKHVKYGVGVCELNRVTDSRISQLL